MLILHHQGKDLPAITATRQEGHSGRNAREVKAAVPPAPPHLCPVLLNPRITPEPGEGNECISQQ